MAVRSPTERRRLETSTTEIFPARERTRMTKATGSLEGESFDPVSENNRQSNPVDGFLLEHGKGVKDPIRLKRAVGEEFLPIEGADDIRPGQSLLVNILQTEGDQRWIQVEIDHTPPKKNVYVKI